MILRDYYDFEQHEGRNVQRIYDGARGYIEECRVQYAPDSCGCCSYLHGYTVDIELPDHTFISLSWDEYQSADYDNGEWELA